MMMDLKAVSPAELKRKLDWRRKLLGITQQQIARECGVSVSTLLKLDRVTSLRWNTHNILTEWLRNNQGGDIPLKNLRAFTGKTED